MSNIKSYIEKNLKLENFNFENYINYNDIKNYHYNVKADATRCYESIEKYLDEDKKNT